MTVQREPIHVLIVDDSPTQRQWLVEILLASEGMDVVGEARTGLEAVRMNHSLKPDVIVIDADIPVMDGLQSTRLIMQEAPTRVVILATETQFADTEFLAQITQVGALDACVKPLPGCSEDDQQRFVKTIRAMAQVGVVRMSRSYQPSTLPLNDYPGIVRRPEIVLIVSSTGGPPALETIIRDLDSTFPLPIVIVQHISDGFLDSMANWLDQVSMLTVKTAENGEKPRSGFVYIAPIGRHLLLTSEGRFLLQADTENARHIPSGDILLESAAQAYGANAIGVVLTGMGVDGATGLAMMHARGAHTIVQDEATSVVFGMPRAAIEQGAGEYILPIDKIADQLKRLANEGAHL